MMAKVFVTLKRAVLDPQGKAVQRSLARLGFLRFVCQSFLGPSKALLPRREPRHPRNTEQFLPVGRLRSSVRA
jgi:hypothetical protein